MKSIIGKKVGMTSIFEANGKQTAVTIIEAGPNVVTQVKSQLTDGYDAVQVAFGEKKEKNTTKAEQNHFAKAQTSPKRYVTEFRNPDASVAKALGETLTCEIFAEGEKIDVVGTSKGKGFQGVVKRHGFGGVGGQTHGQHNRLRAPGSLGASSWPSKVFKGIRMAGRTGGDRVKIQNLQVVKVYAEQNLLVVSGSIPGAKGSYVIVDK